MAVELSPFRHSLDEVPVDLVPVRVTEMTSVLTSPDSGRLDSAQAWINRAADLHWKVMESSGAAMTIRPVNAAHDQMVLVANEARARMVPDTMAHVPTVVAPMVVARKVGVLTVHRLVIGAQMVLPQMVLVVNVVRARMVPAQMVHVTVAQLLVVPSPPLRRAIRT